MAAALVATAGVVLLDPTRRHVPLCPFHAITGWQCPLCGSLRAVDELVHGHLAAAVRDNVLLVAALPVLVVVWIDWARRRTAGQPSRRVPRAVVPAAIAVGMIFTVVRNLPWAAALRP